MSIINEALKKAGREKEAFPLLGLPQTQTTKRKQTFNWGPLFVVLVLLLITGPIIAPIFSTPFKRNPLPSRSAVAPVHDRIPQKSLNTPLNTNRKAQFAVEESPLFQTAASPFQPFPYLNLSGIVYSPSDAYCIINDRILKAGDTIQEARVVEVTQEEAVLDYKGQRLRLNTSNPKA